LKLGDGAKVAVNDRVFVLGYVNNHVDVSEALVTKIGTTGDTRSFQISSQITSSSRGGPVFNVKGEVIGIAGENAAGLSQGSVVPVFYLTNLLISVMGPGGGMGTGVGSGGGIGPGLPSLGPGQGPGVLQPGDRPRATTASSVDTKPLLLKGGNPGYTEEARRNKVEGIVMLRALVGADGAVKRVTIVRGLPDGLDERAIAAAFQARFKPAMKDGQPVEYWVALQMEFRLR
jgi:TonB family protein